MNYLFAIPGKSAVAKPHCETSISLFHWTVGSLPEDSSALLLEEAVLKAFFIIIIW